MRQISILALACATLLVAPARAQEHDHSQMDHSGMNMPGMAKAEEPPASFYFTRCQQTHSGGWGDGMDEPFSSGKICSYSEGSGSSRLPGNEKDAPGLHQMAGDWMLMAHGFVSAQYTDHSGPRGDAKAYATSMAMLMAESEPDWGRVQLRSMLSLEPAMKPKGYPNLLATGETAGGQPLVDRQHPHDLFMELAARIDFNVANNTRLFVYGGPVAEPALGPSAFMHRGSAALNPEPPITHHWFDSTHITYGVATVGLSAPKWQIEMSAFRGAEPDEKRWNIETPKLDSWSVRATLNPSPRWAFQASYGEIEQPEATHPGENEHRFTTSAHYSDGQLSAMAAFSAKKRVPGETLTAWLAEANWDLDEHNTLFGRFENVANDELFPDHHDPLHDVAFRVSKAQVGYARRIELGSFTLALGASANLYAKPHALDAAYGRHPWGYTVFARFSLGN